MSEAMSYALLGKDNEVIHIQAEDPRGKFDPSMTWVTYSNLNVVKVGHFYNPVSKTFYRKVEAVNDRKKGLLFTVNEICDIKTDALVETYPKNERTTFELQRSEAASYTLNNNAPTPFIDMLAKTRGISKEELVKRIHYKSNLLAAAMGYMIGRRQSFEDQLQTLTTHEQLDEFEDHVNRWRNS